MRRTIEHSVRNPVFVNLLMLILVIGGILATLSMKREILPSAHVDIVQVTVPYPGAGPDEVEEGICRKIEEAIEGVEGIKKYSTQSAESMGSATIELADGYDLQKLKDEVADKINAITTFPVDAEKPNIFQATWWHPVVFLSVYGDLPEAQLKELAEDLKDDLSQESGISRVTLFGVRSYEIAIEVSEARLREYGLTFDEVSAAVSRASLNLPGGTVRGLNEEFKVRTMGRRYTAEEFAGIVALSSPGGAIVHLSDIAEVRDTFDEEPVESFFTAPPEMVDRAINGNSSDRFLGRLSGLFARNGAKDHGAQDNGFGESLPSVLLMVMKTEAEDAMVISDVVRRFVREKRDTLPPTVQLTLWNDISVHIQDRIDMLVENGTYGLILVFLMLWIFLDLRLAFWVSMGIPISLAGGMAIGAAMGMSINMISLFALIMMLGIIVDDAIVSGESIYYHRSVGEPALRAAVRGAVEVSWPVTAAVLTTVVAFAPLLFIKGIMGQIIYVIPVIVIAALLVSLIESLVILPCHLRHLPDIRARAEAARAAEASGRRPPLQKRLRHGLTLLIEGVAERLYRPFITKVLAFRYISFAASIAVLLWTAGLVAGGLVKFQFFPAIDGDYVFARVEFPEGTPITATRDALKQIERGFQSISQETETGTGEPLIRGIYAIAGQTFLEPRTGAHLGEMAIELLPTERRKIHYKEIIGLIEDEVGPIPGATTVSYEGSQSGPPGKNIEVWLLSNDHEQLRAAADEVRAYLASREGVYAIEDDFRPGKRELRARLKPEGRTLGLTTADLARQLRQGFYGEESLRVQRGRDEIRVKVRYPGNERQSVTDVESIRIRTAQGSEVPLLAVADVTLEQGYSTIYRNDGRRRVAVTADVVETRTNASEILRDIRETLIPAIAPKYPLVGFAFEGRQDQMQDVNDSLRVWYPLAIMVMYLILATIFRSYIQPAIILAAIPFGIIGAILGHLVSGYDVTMMSMFGMVALSGIVVNDAIVLIERYNRNLAEGQPVMTALVNAGVRRLRAIFLTSVTTFVGLMPLMLERSMQAQFLIPMAIAISYGVLFATGITLVLIPCLIAVLNDLRRVIHLLWFNEWVPRERLEPGYLNAEADKDAVPMME